MIGTAVSSGLFGTKVAVGANDTGFVWARKGALPVAVGPAHNSGDVWKYCGIVVLECEQFKAPGSITLDKVMSMMRLASME